MKTEYQILQEITRLENLDISPDVDYLTRINALAWVLDGEGSAMCEANSNAVLGEVRLTKDELNLLRQWYNAVDDLNHLYLNEEDKILYSKILAHLA